MQPLATFFWLTGFLAVLGTGDTAPKIVRVELVEPELAAHVDDDGAKAVAGRDVVAVEPELAVTDEAAPEEWMPQVRRCSRRGSRRFCDGPRMVPAPHGVAADRATTLGLGTRQAASVALTRAPDEAWVNAVEGEAYDTIHFPIEDRASIFRGFGYVRRGSLRRVRHDGIDIAAPTGTRVVSIDDGLVVYADNGVSGYGNVLVIVHADGSTSLYAHLRAAHVFAGQNVQRGQTIGEVGTTGLSRAPHLHFEYRVNGRLVDPAPRFDSFPG